MLRLPQQAVELLRADADVYHAISPMGGAPAALLGKRPLVVTIHDLIPFNVAGFDTGHHAIIDRYQVTKGIRRPNGVASRAEHVNLPARHGR